MLIADLQTNRPELNCDLRVAKMYKTFKDNRDKEGFLCNWIIYKKEMCMFYYIESCSVLQEMWL